MEEEAELLAEDGIIASVVTTSDLKSTYSTVYETTGGLYANIYDDFSYVLLQLAELIGEETAGNWVIMRHGFKYIRLDLEDSDGDYDGDGLTDEEELGTATIYDLSDFIEEVLSRFGYSISDYAGVT
ncbi:MAG: hypothetical protein LIO55_08375 [Oscillospiraceae bacterium]|nr:hypothetical protein [Oscillospiraceae bacterium]